MMKAYKLWWQYLLPQHLLSRLAGRLMNSTTPWLKNGLIIFFIKYYRVNMQEAVRETAQEYRSFNDFFTRPLKAGCRPLQGMPQQIVCPADGILSQCGTIENGRLIQAKGVYYDLNDLLAGNEEWSRLFASGQFATIYLSPKDYHRVHMPVTGVLRAMSYVPGRLFSVNQTTTQELSGLFTRNERMISLFDTELGAVAVIMVGAVLVASIHTQWHGQLTPRTQIQHKRYDGSVVLQRGAEMGYFELGSTVIVLLGQKQPRQWQFMPQQIVKMGQVLI